MRSGDTVRTSGVQSAAAVVYLDGTRLTLVGDTTVTCADRGRKSVVVHQGTVAASVVLQQEGKPMVLATPAAEVEVLGTDFYCLAQTDQTDVSVTRGRVRVTRVSDGQVVEVAEGKRVLATRRAELAVEDIPRPPDTWDLDFEEGLPKDFHRGLAERNHLPRGSGGAVRPVSHDMGEEGTFYEIATPDMWYHGLFRVHDDSHFHFTFKMDKPGWLNVFVIARGFGPERPYSINYLFNELWFWRRPPGTWQTVSIPLAQFKRMVPREGKAFEGEVPYLVLFSSQGDRGLVIDRVWVTRGGPGVVRYQDIE
jgi:hypothetical protein